MAIFKFESGALGFHGATWGAKGTRMGYDFQIMTEAGLLDYRKKEGEIRFYSKDAVHVPGEASSGGKYVVLHRHEGVKDKETHREITHFIDCVNTGKRPLTDGRAALQSLRIIWKMYEAEKNGTTADLRGLGLNNA
jgi:predicted dehydrogenase